MFELNDKNIEKIAGQKIYEEALDYYNNGKVISIESQSRINSEYRINITDIEAVVGSLQSKENYEVSVGFNDMTGIMHYRCDCASYYSKIGRGMCKHIAAVLIKYCREKKIIEKRSMHQKNNKLIDEIKSNIFSTSDDLKQKINLKIKFEFYSLPKKSSIQFKMGTDKMYVVKDVIEVMEIIKSGTGQIVFGKGFSYSAKQYNFNKSGEALFEIIMEIYEQELISRNHSTSPKMFQGKKVFLTERQLGRIFDCCKENNFEVMANEQEYSNVWIRQENLPLSYKLNKTDEKITLEQINEIPMLLSSSGRYFFYNGNVYKVTAEQFRDYMPFYNQFVSSKSFIIKFDEDEANKLASFVIPVLKSLTSEVYLDENVSELMIETEFKAQIKLDKIKGGIAANINYYYNGDEIDPVSGGLPNIQNKLIIRDIKREAEIIKILESFKFINSGDAFILKDEEESVIDFFVYGVEKLKKVSEVYYSESLKNIRLIKTPVRTAKVGIGSGGLLEVSFNIEGIEEIEVKKIFKDLIKKKKYYKLKNGDVLFLKSEDFTYLNHLMDKLSITECDIEENKIMLPRADSLFIEQVLSESAIRIIEKNQRFIDFLNNFKLAEKEKVKPPIEISEIMRNYQTEGFNWMRNLALMEMGGILADEMGLGKTLQTIAFIASALNYGEKLPSIVITPTSLIYNWENEIRKFIPSLKAIVIDGDSQIRKEKRQEIQASDIVITSYPLIRKDIEVYKQYNFKYCIIDEAQQIKNSNSLVSKSVKQIKAKANFALTGTPIENSLSELWSIFDFILPGYLMTYNKFYKKYELPISRNNDRSLKLLEDLTKKISPFILRRLKSQVYKELPPKIEHTIMVEMTKEQKKVYMAYVNEAKSDLFNEFNERGFNKNKIKLFSILTRLRQICSDPSIFLENFDGESGKFLALDELLENMIEEGHRILLFSQFTSVLKNIKIRLDNNKICSMYLDGHTKTEDRIKLVNNFNEGDSSVFLISLKAGGTGLNLTGADVVIHFDPWWNPAVEDQATDRAHRIGQKKTVEVIRLVTKGTIEEKIYKLHDQKRYIARNIIDGSVQEANYLSDMTEDEVRNLFDI